MTPPQKPSRPHSTPIENPFFPPQLHPADLDI